MAFGVPLFKSPTVHAGLSLQNSFMIKLIKCYLTDDAPAVSGQEVGKGADQLLGHQHLSHLPNRAPVKSVGPDPLMKGAQNSGEPAEVCVGFDLCVCVCVCVCVRARLCGCLLVSSRCVVNVMLTAVPALLLTTAMPGPGTSFP
jgi:hypothetical protein